MCQSDFPAAAEDLLKQWPADKRKGTAASLPRAPTRKFKQVHDERLMRQLLVSSAPVHTGECLPSTTAFICW